MKHPNQLLLVIGLILITANFYVITQFDLLEIRWARIISCALLICYFIFTSGFRTNLLTATFGLFLLSAFLSLYNEVLLIRKLNLGVVILGYLLLMLHVLPLIKNLKTDLLQKVIFLLILCTNLFMLYTLADMEGDKIQDHTQLFLLFLRGIAIIGLGILAFSYCNRYSNMGSIYFLLAVLGLVFSDIFAFVAFYLELQQFVFADRFLYLLGLICLTKYTVVFKKEDLHVSGEML